MGKHISLCGRDTETLEKILRVKNPASPGQPETYRDRVVVKPWGYEFLAFENEHVAVWFLHIHPDHSTSMHCHPAKKTSLVLLSGEALLNTFLRRYQLSGPDAVIIDRGVFHSTKSLSSDGIDLLEVETPPRKTDLVRLSDEYGRQHSGYEGLSDMKRENLEPYGHFFLEEKAHGQRERAGACDVRVERYESPESFRAEFEPRFGEFFCACAGTIIDVDGRTVLEVGDAQDGELLDSFKELHIREPLVVIRVSPMMPGGEVGR
jgi:mannose-6-phosphate isomerase-like protein (cupin superfamily)